MRLVIASLLGCAVLFAASVPAEARTDARAAVQRTSKPTAAPARPAASRAAVTAVAARSAAAPSRSAAVRGAAPAGRPRGVATASRQRARVAVPYGRQQAAASSELHRPALASCRVRNGRRVCAESAAAAPRNVSFRWGGDLAPASMTQRNCPDGTIATTAIGHTDVIRCVPL